MDNSDYRGTVVFRKYPRPTTPWGKGKHKNKSQPNNKNVETKSVQNQDMEKVKEFEESYAKDDCLHNENEFKFNFQIPLEERNEFLRGNNTNELRGQGIYDYLLENKDLGEINEKYFLKNVNDFGGTNEEYLQLNEKMHVDDHEDFEELRNPKSILEKMIRSAEISTENSRMSPENSRTSPESTELCPNQRFKSMDMLEFAKPSRTTSDKGKFSDHMREMKNKLIEGLAVPIESDKAMRMMRLMGWKGGALGVRGEGLIEPIQPQLDIPNRVGLGHKKHESSKLNLNRLQKRILNRRAGINQNEEYFEENDSIDDDYFNQAPKVQERKDMTKKQKRKANKMARKEKKDKNRNKNKNKNKFDGVNDLTIKRNRKIDLSKLKDICLKKDNNEKKDNLNIDPLKLKTVRSEAKARTEKSSNDINYNDLHGTYSNDNSNYLQKAEVNDLQGISSVPNVSVQMNTTYIENSHNAIQYFDKLSNDDSAIQINDIASNQSLEENVNRNCLQTDEEVMVRDNKIVRIGDSDVQMIDDASNNHDNIQVDNCVHTHEENKVCSDKIEIIDGYAKDSIQNIDDASYGDDQIQVIDNCLQTNDEGVRVNVDKNMIINDDGCDVQNIDSVSNTNEETNANFAQTSDKRVSGEEDPFMMGDHHIQDVDNVSYHSYKIEVNTNIKTHEEGDDEYTSMKDGNYNDKHAQNINKVYEQTRQQDNTYCELRNSNKIIVDESFQQMIDNIDKNLKYISDIFKQVEQLQPDTCEITDERTITDDNDNNSQSIDKVDYSEQIQLNTYCAQINDEEINSDKYLIDVNDKDSQSIDEADKSMKMQLNTNCVQINDKEVNRDDKYVIDVNDKDSQNIDELDKSMQIQFYTDCVQVNDKEVITDEINVINVNDKIFQNIDKIDNSMQIQISDKEVITDYEHIIIHNNDNKNQNKDETSHKKVVQINTNNVHDNDKERFANHDNNKTNDNTLYPDVSDEGYEYYELDIGVKKSSNRLVLLVNILELVQSEYRFTIIRFPFKIPKKFTSYITRTVSSLNEREHVVFENEREHVLLKAIAREMTAHWGMRLVCRLRRECRKQIATIIKSYNNRPVSGPFCEDNNFITTHSIPDYREYDGMPPNTKVDTGYHKLVNRIIRDFVKSKDVERVYEFTSQVEVKTYINAVVGLLNGRNITVNLGLGETEYGVFCETAAGMEGIFLIARYDCPYLIFEKLQLVKVHLAKRCSICQQELNSNAISTNNDKNYKDAMHIEEIDDAIVNNDSENITLSSTSKQIQNRDVNEHEMDGNDFVRERTDSCEIKDVHSYTYENTKICKNVGDKFDNIKSSTVLACLHNECDSGISENIDNTTEFHEKLDTEKSKRGDIYYNRETSGKTYAMDCLSQNENANVETDKVLEKPEGTSNNEMDDDMFDRLQYKNQSKDECLNNLHFDDTSNDDKFGSHGDTKNIDGEDSEEYFNIKENIKCSDIITKYHQIQQNPNDNIVRYYNKIHNDKSFKYSNVIMTENNVEDISIAVSNNMDEELNNEKTSNYEDKTENKFEDILKTVSNEEKEPIKEKTPENSFPKNSTQTISNVSWPRSVIIMHKNHLEHKIDLNSAMLLQSIIYNATKTSQELPRLKCCGIKNDGVVYSCFDNKSYNWLVDAVSFYFKILDFEPDFKTTHIIELRINTLIKVDTDLILSNIETSHALNTVTWNVIQERIYPEYCVLTIEVDDNSLTVIKNEQYSLFVGFDKADVSVLHK